MRKLLFIAILFSSCSVARYTPTEDSAVIQKETRQMLNSRVNTMAGAKKDGLTYYLILNENKTFSAIVDMDNSKQYDFCAGTFEFNADTLNLNYYKNYKSKYLTDKAVVDDFNKEIRFIGGDDESASGTRIKILNEL